MKKWKKDTPFARVGQSCASELYCAREGKEHNWKIGERDKAGQELKERLSIVWTPKRK